MPAPPTTTSGLRRVRRRLVEEHLDLVSQQARRVRRELDVPVESDDLEGYGHEALVRAARRFDPRLGVPFGAYARFRVRGAILDGVAEMGGIPRRLYRRLRFDRASSEVAGDWVGQDAASDAAGIREELHTAFLLASHACDDWGPTGDQEELRRGRALLQGRVRRGLEALPPRERTLLVAHYVDGLSLAEAGRRIGVSRSFAARLHRQALRNLRVAMGLGRRAP